MAQNYYIEGILFETPPNIPAEVVTRFVRRLDEHQVAGVARSFFQIARTPNYDGPYIHAMRVRDQNGIEVFRWNDFDEVTAAKKCW